MGATIPAYVETLILLAVMEDDEDRAAELIADMLPGERATLRRQVDRMRQLLGEDCLYCHEPVDPNSFTPMNDGIAHVRRDGRCVR